MSKATAESVLSELETPILNTLYATVLANCAAEQGLNLTDKELEANIISYASFHACDVAEELRKAWEEQCKEASK